MCFQNVKILKLELKKNQNTVTYRHIKLLKTERIIRNESKYLKNNKVK